MCLVAAVDSVQHCDEHADCKSSELCFFPGDSAHVQSKGICFSKVSAPVIFAPVSIS